MTAKQKSQRQKITSYIEKLANTALSNPDSEVNRCILKKALQLIVKQLV